MPLHLADCVAKPTASLNREECDPGSRYWALINVLACLLTQVACGPHRFRFFAKQSSVPSLLKYQLILIKNQQSFLEAFFCLLHLVFGILKYTVNPRFRVRLVKTEICSLSQSYSEFS